MTITIIGAMSGGLMTRPTRRNSKPHVRAIA